MALVRILVDGYSLLHAWPELAAGRARHSAAARDELIRWLTLYQDATRTPVTVVFDGAGAPKTMPRTPNTAAVEVLYAPRGKSADELIERAAHRLQRFGEVLVVTDDFVERDTAEGVGAFSSSCLGFIQTVENELGELERDRQHHNRRERLHFSRPH